MSLVHIDVGHLGRTGGRTGARGQGLREEGLALAYSLTAAQILRDAGHEVQVWTAGSYRARQMAARSARADVYVAAHVNAGGHEYGLVLYRSATGKQLAAALADELEGDAPELTRATTIRATRDDWTRHAYALIEHVGPAAAVVYEPAFIDQAAHLPLLQSPDRIGRLLAAGILQYLDDR